MTKKLLVPAGLLAKSQVAAYTRKDGTVVQAHDNGRQAAAPKAPIAGASASGGATKYGAEYPSLAKNMGKRHIHSDYDSEDSAESREYAEHVSSEVTGGSTKYTHEHAAAALQHAGRLLLERAQKAERGKNLHIAKTAHDLGHKLLAQADKHTSAASGAQGGKPATHHVAGKKEAAARPSAVGGGYSVAAFKHGGHQIKEPDGTRHVILQDKGVADRHAGALNHVATSGKDAHMNESIHAAAKKHMGLDSFDEVGSDREDFVDTGKGGLKAALHHAYDAGAGHSKGGAHRDAVVAEAAKHFGQFDSLEQEGHDGADFKEVGKGLLKHALKHAYASGAQKAQAKPASKLAVRASVAKQATTKPSSAAPQKAADAAPGPMTPDAVKEHALQSGAKWKSNVAVFSRPESAHSFAETAATSKGSAFVMKHPNHAHHVVVSGADSQRMSKNGYEYVRPVMKGRGY